MVSVALSAVPPPGFLSSLTATTEQEKINPNNFEDNDRTCTTPVIIMARLKLMRRDLTIVMQNYQASGQNDSSSLCFKDFVPSHQPWLRYVHAVFTSREDLPIMDQMVRMLPSQAQYETGRSTGAAASTKKKKNSNVHRVVLEDAGDPELQRKVDKANMIRAAADALAALRRVSPDEKFAPEDEDKAREAVSRWLDQVVTTVDEASSGNGATGEKRKRPASTAP